MKKLIKIIALSLFICIGGITTTGCVSSGSGVGIRSAGNSHYVIKGVEGNVTIHTSDNDSEQTAGKTLDALKAAANTAVQGSGIQQTKSNASVEPTESDSNVSGDQSADGKETE